MTAHEPQQSTGDLARPGVAAGRFGQYPPAEQLIVHMSDTHLLGGGRPLYGTVDTDTTVHQAMAQLERSGLRPDVIVLTGDIADRGEADAYRRIRDIVERTAERVGAEVLWVMGNHDERSVFRTELLRETPSTAPVDRVIEIRGLRLIALDTSVPGYHHGELSPAQLDWLADQLRTPAPRGTLLALHHPPVPAPFPLMNILELQRQDALAAVVEHSDIRGILGGHLHCATTSLFAGIPVSVAAATCYTMDPSAPVRELTGVNGGQSLNLVHIYSDQIVHSVVPIGEFPVATRFDETFLARMEALDTDARLEAFSRQAQA